MNKVLYLLLLSIFSPLLLSALGQTEEADYKQVSGKENWEYEVPIQDMEEGEYNLLIRAKDKANNETFAGPFNILVDPESDLPIVSITNPLSFMRVGGVLNIVGTARDDDAIKTVLLKIDDGEYFEAVGQEFWSFLLDPKTLSDGEHLITAKAIDINGVVGKEISVKYNQDTNKPTNSIENYENGAIFSGKVNINGKVIDANGIANLELSTDGQKTYTPIKFIKDKVEDFYTFEMPIDTKKLDDGPNIYWYKSIDKTGSIAFTPFLFFVDNIGPEITVVDPLEDTSLNGIIHISGKISDSIGVKSLNFYYGEVTGEIILQDGNPYWSQEIDLSAEKKDNAEIEFVSEDMSGNITTLEYNVTVDTLADKPVLNLISPTENTIYKNDLIIEGSILDDDYVNGLEYSIDGEEVQFFKVFNSFSKTISGLKTGKHILTTRAKDNFGIVGDSKEIPFEIDSFNPEISINSISINDEENIYYPGYNVTVDGGYKILGTVNSGNPIASFMYNIENGDYRDLEFNQVGDGTTKTFNIKVDNSFHYGIVNYSIKVVDVYGHEEIKKSQIYVKNYSVINDEWGLYYNKIPENGIVSIKDDEPFEMFFNGPDIKSLSTYPETSIFTLSNRGKVIKAEGNNDGIVEGLKFIVDTDKGLFETKTFNFIYDSKSPLIEVEFPETDSVQSKLLTLKGNVTELKLKKLEYRLSNQNEYNNINFIDNLEKQNFNTTVNIPDTTNETLSIEVRATDTFGNISTLFRSFNIGDNKFIQTLTNEEITINTGKASDKPILFINFPITNQVFFSEPYLSGFSRDDDSIQSIKISDSEVGGQSKTLSISGLFDISLLDFGSGQKNLDIIAIDVNGTESKIKRISYTYIPENTLIKQNLKLGDFISYVEGVSLTGEIISSVKGNLEYKFNDSDYQKTNITDGKYSIIIPKSLKWGRNNITLKFNDIYGRASTSTSFFYLVDRSNLSSIKDDNGIYFNDQRISEEFIDLSEKNNFIGFFNGRKIKEISLEAEKKDVPEFITISNTNNKIIIKSIYDGVSEKLRVVIESIDGDKFWSDYFKFISDDTEPLLEIQTPNNSFIKGSLLLKGRVKDDIKVNKLSYSLNRGTTWLDLDLTLPPVLVSKEKYTKTSPLDYIKVEPKEPKEFLFEQDINYANMVDSGYTVWVKALDSRGNEVIKTISFMKDNTNPELELFIPGVDEINGRISLIGKTSDNIELDVLSYSLDGISFTDVSRSGVFKFDIDFGMYEQFPETFVIKSIDKAGNYTEVFPVLNINQEKDKPIVEIQTPLNGEIIRNDFVISGMAFDDDRVDTIYYSLDGGELKPVAKNENNFSIDITLESIDDNEHIISVKAVDILGVESDLVTSNFWVSKKEPTSTLILPKIESTKRDTIKLVGQSFDENGIDSVYISTDNGVSYQKATGQEDWNYTFNTKNIKDGTYSLFVKSIDKLQTIGFYSTLINIDNTPPELFITEPTDGDILSDKIIFSGRSLDNVSMNNVQYKIYNHSAENDNGILIDEGELGTQGIFNIDIPLDGYDIGDYNIELIAYDQAENRSILTRNFTVAESDNAGDIEMLFPQPGSILTSEFEVSGQVLGRKEVNFVNCYIDGELFSEIKINEFNFFNLKINTLQLTDGPNEISLKATLNDGQIYDTPKYNIIVKNSGEWLNIINMKTGENISGRPFITGESGYIYNIPTEEIPEESLIVPTLVEVSLDNGQIFESATGTSNWEFRIETWKYEDGLTPILVRSTFSNGEIKTDRIVVNIDRSQPEVSVLEDLEQGRFNESIKLSGIASDANGLTDISVILREGDKANYEIPGLFQGMFIDTETGYGKIYGIGVGLTFFDDNVKIQGTFGETRTLTEDARIKGFYYGFKLLANLYSINLGSLFGPDLEPFSMSAAVGASFTNKTLTVSDEDSTMWFSAMLAQLEFFKMSFDNDYLSSIAMYIDLESTLISSESDGGFYTKIGIGSRITLF